MTSVMAVNLTTLAVNAGSVSRGWVATVMTSVTVVNLATLVVNAGSEAPNGRPRR